MKTLEVLPADELKVLKVIQINGPDWNKFRAYLPYVRSFNPKAYDHDNGDILDEKILSTIQHYYPNSSLSHNSVIMFKGDIEERLRIMEGGSRKKITIQFSPDISYELLLKMAGQTFHAYPLEFEMRVWFGAKENIIEQINGFYLCSIPFDQLDEIVKTIKPI